MHIRREEGMALVVALMALLLLSALGAALMMTTQTETLISANFRNAGEGLYAADAVVERAMDDLLTVPDWDKLLDGSLQSGFIDGPPSGERQLPDGSKIDLTQAVNMANCNKVTTCSDADMNAITRERPWATNNPRWRPYAYGRISDLVPNATINSSYYALVMVADDPSETDGDPLHDGVTADNMGRGVLAMRAEAFGPRGAHKVIELTVARTNTNELERGYTGQRGQDEQNRRARKSPVQSPGKALTQQTMGIASGGIQ
jgi:hypothetical protein